MKYKKIYSLNLIAFLQYFTGIKGKLMLEPDKNQVYALFPDDVEIKLAIKEFKNNGCMVNLHSYLNEFKSLKNEISAIRGGKDA